MPLTQGPVNRRLLGLTWPFVALVMTMVTLSAVSIVTITAIRAYVGGESYWSKAERDAAFFLIRYSHSGRHGDYQSFERAADVILGDHRARLTLQSAKPDVALAVDGFAAGRNDPDDLMALVQLFRAFGKTELMRPAIELWTEGDRLFKQMVTLGEDIQARWAISPLDDYEIADYVSRIEALHAQLMPLADAFTVELGATSRLVSRLLIVSLSICALTLLIAALWKTRNMLIRSAAISEALQASQRLAHAEQERAQVTLHSIGDAVVSVDSDGRIEYLNTAAEELTGWTSAEAATRPFAEVLHLIDEHSANPIELQMRRVLNDGVAQELTQTGQLVHRDGRRIPIDEMAAPIRDREGRIVGIVLVMRDVTHERALAAQLHYQATHDALTGLHNREEFDRQLRLLLETPTADGNEHAVIMMDLDQFKIVNDTCGHAAGDELLRRIGSLIIDRLPPQALLARLGGDEFGVLLPAIGLTAATAVADAIRECVALHRFIRDGKSFSSSASIGIVAIAPDMTTPGVVLNAVDRACYMSKENGRNRVHVYRPDDQELRQRSGEMAVIAQIDSAIEEQRLLLFGQEIRSLGDGAAADSHIELLVRMVSPEGKLVPPMSFIPAAERYGVMNRIDRWIIARAFQTLQALRDRGEPLPRCMINLSGQSLVDETLCDFLLAQFALTGLPYDRIGFEITETSAITNMIVAVEMMRRLSALGCVIALDDFGSGMSSFTYLRSMPVHCLKIDGNLVTDFRRNPVHRVMVMAIQQIAKVMGVKTVAEWVEDEATCIELTRIGIDYAQGHYLSRPEPIEEAFRRWRTRLDDQQPAPASAESTAIPMATALARLSVTASDSTPAIVRADLIDTARER